MLDIFCQKGTKKERKEVKISTIKNTILHEYSWFLIIFGLLIILIMF